MRKTILVAAVLAAIALPARAESEVSVVVQGGGMQYNRDLAGATDFGVGYGVRVGIMPDPIIGVEIGYLGSQNNVKRTLQTSGDSERLITNGAAADLRVNILPGAITPYVFGGIGVTRITVGNQSLQSPFSDSTLGTIPLGAGVEANAGAFKIGARFQYNYLLNNFYNPVTNSTTSTPTGGRNSDFYGFTVDVGASFH